MSWLKDLFATEHPIIGLLHLRPLPGDPFFAPGGTIRSVIDAARSDLLALQQGGVDGVLVTNEFSIPYEKKVGAVTTASMAMVIGALSSRFSVPFGAEAIYDGDASIELCAATGASFTRCLFTGAWAGDLGLVDRDVAHTLRLKRALGLDQLRLFYFVTSEGEVFLNDRSPEDIAKTLLFNCRPDALVAGGSAPGQNPAPELLKSVRHVSEKTPVFCGTGCRVDNVSDILAVANGAFVGTTFKRDGKFDNPVDPSRVQSFMEHVRKNRKD